MRLLPFILPVLLLCSCARESQPDRHTRDLLSELDGYIRAREMYVVRKKDQMDILSQMARKQEDPLRRYEQEMDIAEGYFSFSFDSTQTYLKHCLELAGSDLERYDRALIRLGRLYVKSGNYLEARQILYGQVDKERLSENLLNEYLYALYDFSHDLAGNSGMVERLSIPPEAPFRDSLLKRLPANSETWRELLRDSLMAENNLSAADSVSRLLLGNLTQENRNYAIYAFFRSEIAEMDGRHEDRLDWLVKSAESDIINAVRDYASLTLVADHVLPVDVDHAFNYLQIAQEDALSYNAKLRPWQISRFLMDVGRVYMDRQAQKQRTQLILLLLLAVLSVALLVISWSFVNRSRKLSRVRQELESANSKLESANATLNSLNRQISKADQVKEAYILDFLQDLSGQIAFFRSEDNHSRNLLRQGKADQLLRELSLSSHSEKARDKFYETFDKTFLGMYPDFVEQFNSLLQEDARFSPPKGRLNTELRIFALIRLGINDSKQIASMLDYSVSTIYNYKVSVRNSALGDRDSFDERVRQIVK